MARKSFSKNTLALVPSREGSTLAGRARSRALPSNYQLAHQSTKESTMHAFVNVSILQKFVITFDLKRF